MKDETHQTRRRPVLAGLCVAGALSILTSACAAPAPGGTSNGGEQALSIVWETGQKKGLDAVVEAFKSKNPGVTVNVDYLSADQITSQIPQQLAAGQGPDLFRSDAGSGTPQATLTLANRGLTAPFTGDWTSKIPADLAKNVTKDGKLYGFPVAITGMGLFMNNKQLEAHGLTVPTTFSEVLRLCKDARDKGTVAFASGPATRFDARAAVYAMSYETVYSQHPDFDQQLKDGSLTWQDSGWGTAIDRQLEMVNAGCFPDRFTGLDFQGAFELLFGGKTLGMVGYSAYMIFAPESADFSFHPMPASDDPEASGMVASPWSTVAMNAKAKNAELAQKFVDFLATEEGDGLYVKAVAPKGGIIPTFYDKTSPPTDQMSKKLFEYLGNGRSNHFPDATFPSAQITSALETNMQSALQGKLSSNQVLEAVQAAYDQAAK